MPFPTVDALIRDGVLLCCTSAELNAPALLAKQLNEIADSSSAIGRACSSKLPPGAVESLFEVCDASTIWTSSTRKAFVATSYRNAILSQELQGRSHIISAEASERFPMSNAYYAASQKLKSDAALSELILRESSARNAVVLTEYGAFTTWLYDAIPQWLAAVREKERIRHAQEAAAKQAADEAQRQVELELARKKAEEESRLEALRLMAAQREAAVVRQVQIRQLQEEEQRLAQEVEAKRLRDEEAERERQRQAREDELRRLAAEEEAMVRRRLEQRQAQIEELIAEEAAIIQRMEQRAREQREAAEARQRQIEELKAAEQAELERQRAIQLAEQERKRAAEQAELERKRAAEEERLREEARKREAALQELREHEAKIQQHMEERARQEALRKDEEARKAKELHDMKIQALKAQEAAAMERIRAARERELQEALRAADEIGHLPPPPSAAPVYPLRNQVYPAVPVQRPVLGGGYANQYVDPNAAQFATPMPAVPYVQQQPQPHQMSAPYGGMIQQQPPPSTPPLATWSRNPGAAYS